MNIQRIDFVPKSETDIAEPTHICYAYSFKVGAWFSGVGKTPQEAWEDLVAGSEGNGEIDRSTLKMFEIQSV